MRGSLLVDGMSCNGDCALPLVPVYFCLLLPAPIIPPVVSHSISLTPRNAIEYSSRGASSLELGRKSTRTILPRSTNHTAWLPLTPESLPTGQDLPGSLIRGKEKELKS